MEFSINQSLQILERTPLLLSVYLDGLDDDWTVNNEGGSSWNVKEVLAHLIVCEKSNWIPRAKIILQPDSDKQFVPIDMNAHFNPARVSSCSALLSDFSELRKSSLRELHALNLHAEDLKRRAYHPVLAEITLAQLISTWVCHDLCHVAQISRIIATQYKDAVGPFIKYLKFIQKDRIE